MQNEKFQVLLYLRAVPPTSRHVDIRIIPGIFNHLMITAEADKIFVILEFYVQSKINVQEEGTGFLLMLGGGTCM